MHPLEAAIDDPSRDGGLHPLPTYHEQRKPSRATTEALRRPDARWDMECPLAARSHLHRDPRAPGTCEGAEQAWRRRAPMKEETR